MLIWPWRYYVDLVKLRSDSPPKMGPTYRAYIQPYSARLPNYGLRNVLQLQRLGNKLM